MSKKISEYFKATPKDQNSSNCGKKAEIKVENLPEIRDCQVIIKDIKNQFQKELKMFDEISLKGLENSETKLIKKGREICKFCGKKLVCLQNLHRHLKNVHSNQLNILNCSLCSFKFMNQGTLDIHMKKKHPNGQTEHFECDFDGKIFKSKGDIYHHMKVHLPDVECHICHKIVKFNSLKSHLKDTHATENNFQCKICSKIFKSSQILSHHEKMHNKKFQCEICKNMQSSQGQLNHHIKLYHENTETYKCETCKKEFRQKHNLMRHQKTHDRNRPKPFKCHRCDFATDNKIWITKHQEFHDHQDKKFAAMKNPLKCEKCSTFHRNKKSLSDHMRQVHPEVQFQCDLCAMFIKTRKSLIKHMKLHIQKNTANLITKKEK